MIRHEPFQPQLMRPAKQGERPLLFGFECDHCGTVWMQQMKDGMCVGRCPSCNKPITSFTAMTILKEWHYGELIACS